MERCPNDIGIPTPQMRRFFREIIQRPTGTLDAKIKYNPNQTLRGQGLCIKDNLIAQLGSDKRSCSGSCGDCGCRVTIDSTFTPYSLEVSDDGSDPQEIHS